MNYKKRIYEQRVKECAKLFKIILLVGARQVGKSSLLAHLFPNYKTFVFDPVQDLYGIKKDPDRFLLDFKAPLILDEIQYAPELLPALKRHVDQMQEKGRYFLTGSQQLSLLHSVSESLAGRVVVLPLFPMTPHEMYAHFDEHENWFLAYLHSPDSFFIDRNKTIAHCPSRLIALWRGGMPGIIDLPDSALSLYFSSYIQTYVERDIRLLENIENSSTFGSFVALLAALTSQEINYTQLGREIGISPKTAHRWLQLLIHTHQWTELKPFHMNALKRLSSKPKGIIADSGLACYLQRLSSPDALAATPLHGALFESYCFNMLKGLCSALPLMPNFYHWRTLAGAEIDIIIEYNGTYYPIEIKSSTIISKHDIRGLEAFKQTYPQLRIAKGIIIYTGTECYRVTDDVVAVPWNLA